MQNNAKNRKGSTVSNGSENSNTKNNGGAASNPSRPTSKIRHESATAAVADLEERKQIVLWRRPIQTVQYFFSEIPCAINDAGKRYYLYFIIKWKRVKEIN